MNVKLSNGHVAEIQIHILGIFEAKMETDCMSYMDVMRGLDAVNEKRRRSKCKSIRQVENG